MAGPVRMYDPNEDRVKLIAPEDAERAEYEGLLPETADETKLREYEKTAGLGEAAKAGLEGLASGATLGLSDVVLSEALGDDYREGRQLRSETFGGLETAGQIVGGIAPVLLSGGTGAAAKGASMLPTSLAARTALGAERAVAGALSRAAVPAVGKSVMREAAEGALRLGIGGAVEGGLAGAGMALSEAALADELNGFDAAAERAWAGAQSGAMFGLFGGAALGGLSGAAVGASRGLMKRVGKNGDALAEAANERAVKALDARGTDIRKLRSEAKAQQIGEDLRNYTLKDGTPVLEALDNVQTLAPKVRQALGEVSEELGEIRQKVASVPEPVDAAGYLRRVDDEVLQPLLSSPSPTVQRQGKRLARELQALRERVAGADAIDLSRARYSRELNPDKLKAIRDAKPKTLKPIEVGVYTDGVALTDGRHRLAVAQEQGAKNIRAKVRRYDDDGNLLSESEELLSLGAPPGPVTYADLLQQQQALKAVAYPKKAPGAGLSVAPDWAAHIVKAERMLEETLEGHVEKTLAKVSPDDIGRYQEMRRLTESFKKADDIAKKSVGQNLGNRSTSLSDYMTGIGAGAAVFDGGASIVGGLVASQAHKFARERGSALLATLYTRSQQVNKRMTQGLNGFFTRARQAVNATRISIGGLAVGNSVGFSTRQALKAAQNESDADAYDRVVAKATAIVNGSAVGPMTIDDVAPETGHQMRLVQQRAAHHLVRNAPVPPRTSNNPNLGALAGDAKPDPVSLYEFSRRVAAIDDPLSVLDDLKAGTISVASVEAVREVYPRLYAEMQARVLDALGASKELLPYEERVRVGILFDLPTDQTLRPEYLQITQAAYTLPEAPKGGATPLPPGRSNKRLMSASEELEIGDSPS